jgi:hypothetical protein
MNNGALYRAAVEAEDRIMATLSRLRYAQNDVRSRGLAYDSSAADGREVYLSALANMGIARDEVRGLTSYDMEKMLRCMPARGSRARRPSAMAYDVAQNDALAGILAGVPTPIDLSDR